MSSRSPLYEAQNAARYERQALIREYQRENDCRLVVVSDMIFPHSITLFEERFSTQNHSKIFTLCCPLLVETEKRLFGLSAKRNQDATD